MSSETVKCPYCGYVYRIDIDRVVEYGQTVAVRGPERRINPKPGREMYVDLKCPNCDKEFEWLAV